MALGIVVEFGNYRGVFGVGFQLPTLPKRIKSRPSLWQKIKEVVYQLALGCMPCPAYGG